MGVDRRGRVYIGFTGRYHGSPAEDFGVFRWDPATDRRSFLGSFRGVARAFGNLAGPKERIPKGHTRFVLVGDKLFMGSQGFHDFKGRLDGLGEQRGAHLFSFDTTSDTWDEVSSRCEEGVIAGNDGLLVLDRTPCRKKLVGLLHPSGAVVVYDPQRDEIERTMPGIPWRLGYGLSRQIITEKVGVVYTSRGHEWPEERDRLGAVGKHDLATGASCDTGLRFKGGFFNGKTASPDGSRIYLSTANGELYAFDTAVEELEHLGHFLPAEELSAGRRIRHVYGHVMSRDGRRLYAIPSWECCNLYEYDIERRRVERLAPMEPGAYVTYDLRDPRGALCFAHWQSGRRNAHLLRIDIRRRPKGGDQSFTEEIDQRNPDRQAEQQRRDQQASELVDRLHGAV
jgi:hypothetical protein